MRITRSILFFSLLALVGFSRAANPAKHDCVAFSEAIKLAGTTHCVKGTVFHVADGNKGVTFLNFCEDGKLCPFSVIVFADDLKNLGDLHLLEGHPIEIKGTIQDYDGRAQMVLRHTQQLGESAFVVIPRVPTDYDVEREGHYSSGKYSHPKTKKSRTNRGSSTSIEDPEEPQ